MTGTEVRYCTIRPKYNVSVVVGRLQFFVQTEKIRQHASTHYNKINHIHVRHDDIYELTLRE